MNTPLQNSTPASPPMGEALQQLLANPDLLRRVREILAPTAETPADAPSEDSPVSAAPSTPHPQRTAWPPCWETPRCWKSFPRSWPR